MSTLFCIRFRIESCLNSRPIAPVSDNLDDYNTLIPGHFLVGTSLIASAEFSVFDLKKQIFTLANDPTRDWRFLEGLVRQLLALFNHCNCCTCNNAQNSVVQRLAKVSQIVIVRDSLALSSQWKLCYITCHSGDDFNSFNSRRKNKSFEYKRPVIKLVVAINTKESEDSVTADWSSI